MANESSAPQNSQNPESLPDYKRVLSFWDLFFISTGLIVGSGVMIFTGEAIGITGRSVSLAYIGAAVWVIFMGIPTILLSSCIRLIGGQYTQSNIFLGERWGGFYLSIYILSQLGLTLYAQTFALYFCELIGGGNQTIVAGIMITFFYFINFFGVDIMAKAQNIMSGILILVLIWFVVRGLPKVNWGTFFASENFMTNGWKGLFSASTLLTYSLLGGTGLIVFSAEAKNPKRDIPMAAAISTIVIAILFALIGIVASGILPLDQVANQTLGVIANHFLTRPEYIVFMVGGALCATATTLNGMIGSVTKPLVMLSYDGWLPKTLGDLHPKYKTPYKYLLVYYIITMLPLFLGVDISAVSDMTLLGSYTQSALFIFFMRSLPDKFPEQWEKSIFRMPRPIFTVIMWVCFLAAASNVVGMLTGSDIKTIIFNVAFLVVGVLFSVSWYKSGKVHPSKSWEDA